METGAGLIGPTAEPVLMRSPGRGAGFGRVVAGKTWSLRSKE